MRSKIVMFLFLAWGFSIPALANDIKVSGFATLDINISNSQTAGIRHVISQPDASYLGDPSLANSSIGVQFEWQSSSQLQWVAQTVLKERKKYKLDYLIQMAFARYTLTPNWQLRIGRTGLDLYMMTEFRDIGYAFNYGHPPTEFYAVVPHQNLDGIDITYTYPLEESVLTYKFFSGKSSAPIISDDDFTWDVELDSIYGLSLSAQTENWLLRTNYTTTKAGNTNEQQILLLNALQQVPQTIWPTRQALIDSLQIKGKRFNYFTVGAKYDDSAWIMQSELSYIDSDSEVLNHLKAGYISLGMHVDDDTWLMTLSAAKSNNRIDPGPLLTTPQLATLYQGVIRHTNFYLIDQHTWSISWRRSLTSTLAAKIQLDHTQVKQLPSAFYLHKDLSSANHDNDFQSLGLSLNWVF
ncbi:hypothetical protein CWB99_21490 [Pseudoalteromonas rubra]|uniref:Porin domain-containing protein n=1 Tax=Pseudoalteromonas rubra TaxID=43658 RepID=A0A5S3WFQ6_9GAMM|nr:hypothetical protein [Pseudoalteromonas rubra]TMP25102.1 hypothetical protein CWB99_21490 [Pseudoalteromonas rubra]TMP28358.1 hypothetical protein CWC00_21530 [Pseudoalteromonas rubra]